MAVKFTQPAPSEFKFPSDEVIRNPYQLPDWWDKPVKWNKGKQDRIGGRPKRGEQSIREKIVAILGHSWKTKKELVEILGRNPKSVTEAVRLGISYGIFVRRVRKGVEYEYANKT